MPQHDRAVLAGEGLGPTHGKHVVIEMRRALAEIGQITVWQVGDVVAHIGLCQLDEMGADGVTDATRTRMQHHPHRTAFVETDLDKVIAGTERTQVPEIVGLVQARVQFAQALEVGLQTAPGRFGQFRRLVPGALVARALAAAMRHRTLDGAAQGAQIVRQIGRHQAGARRDHAAADVHADGRRNDGAAGRHDRTHGRTDAEMHIGHRCHKGADHRQARQSHQLATRLVLDRHALGKHLDRHATVLFDQLKIRCVHDLSRLFQGAAHDQWVKDVLQCSTWLGYGPEGPAGFEPTTPGLM